MAQETTQAFGDRLSKAVEAHPLAPEQAFGRVTWLKRELEAKAQVKVSLNTVHKWMRGTARPREDRLRDLARVLQVDEVWLAFGSLSAQRAATNARQAAQANGAALFVAGLVELSGGRVTFSESRDAAAQSRIHANLPSGVGAEILAVVPQVNGETLMFTVPEPAGDARVVGVVPPAASGFPKMLDLAGHPRQFFGGFSMLEVHKGEDGAMRSAEGNLVQVIEAVERLGGRVKNLVGS